MVDIATGDVLEGVQMVSWNMSADMGFTEAMVALTQVPVEIEGETGIFGMPSMDMTIIDEDWAWLKRNDAPKGSRA